MQNPNFKTAYAIALAALISAAIILALACLLPELLINRLEERISPKLEKTIELVNEERYIEAVVYSNEVLDDIKSEMKPLELCFGHDVVYGLYGAALSAAQITFTGDSAQILEELCSVKSALEYMKSINKASVYNLL